MEKKKSLFASQKKQLKQNKMIHIIITAYGEPKATARAVEAILNQNPPKCKILVTDPFPETEKFIKKRFGKKVEFYADPGEGKSYVLNILLEKIFTIIS